MCMEMRTGMRVWAEAGAGVFYALRPGAGPLLCWTGECDGAGPASQQHVGHSTCSSARPWPGVHPHAQLLQTVGCGLASLLNISLMGRTQPSVGAGVFASGGH